MENDHNRKLPLMKLKGEKGVGGYMKNEKLMVWYYEVRL
jgi:hypothetical protein